MNAELTRLETRLKALLEAYQAAAAENAELRVRVNSLQAENLKLSGKVVTVTERVEKLLACLPEEDK